VRMTWTMRRRSLGALAFLAAALAAAPALAEYPDRAVHLVVPNPPGGVTDVLARIIAQRLSEAWNQAVVVDNRPGGDETIAADSVARAAPDGYTLLVSSNAPIIGAPHLHKDVRYDPFRDFTPVMPLAQVTPTVNVPSALPVHTIAELIALAKAKPGTLNYGSFGNGTYAHLAMEDFKQRTGTNLVHIPYKGSSPAITALLRNEISVLIVNESTVDTHVKSGAVRIIASAGAKRPAAFPDIPTVAETVPGFATGSWWGMFGPANLPRAVIEKIRGEMTAILRSPEARKLYETNTLETMDVAPDAFAPFIRREFDHQGALIKMVGIVPD
jgi:tripartite-type tricarboxylate transporter receptor subunit TctC